MTLASRFKIEKLLGDGSFGSVFLATSIVTGDRVAIKQMKTKYERWEDCLALREIKVCVFLIFYIVAKETEFSRKHHQTARSLARAGWNARLCL
jgi:serine/threonine protein kinase